MALRIASELHHHTPEQASGYLGQALAILHDHDLDPADHDATLAQLVAVLQSKQVQIEQVGGLGIIDGRRIG